MDGLAHYKELELIAREKFIRHYIALCVENNMIWPGYKKDISDYICDDY